MCQWRKSSRLALAHRRSVAHVVGPWAWLWAFRCWPACRMQMPRCPFPQVRREGNARWSGSWQIVTVLFMGLAWQQRFTKWESSNLDKMDGAFRCSDSSKSNFIWIPIFVRHTLANGWRWWLASTSFTAKMSVLSATCWYKGPSTNHHRPKRRLENRWTIMNLLKHHFMDEAAGTCFTGVAWGACVMESSSKNFRVYFTVLLSLLLPRLFFYIRGLS